MPNQLNSGELVANISSELADNNAGLISAYDVRHNLEDIAVSINKIVSSGDTNTEFPFYNIVKISAEMATDPESVTTTSGDIVIESGAFFPNSPYGDHDKRQVRPFLGAEGISHGDLNAGSLIAPNDDHTQYYHLDGRRPLDGNMSTDTFWVNKSGVSDVGFKFEQLNPDATEQEIYVSGQMRWVEDNSIMRTAKGNSKAWLNFDASGTYDGVENLPVVRSWHNISGVQRDKPGRFTVTFNSGTFENNNYTAIGTATARDGSVASAEDFELNTVGIVMRTGDDGTTLRSCTVAVLDDSNQFVDSEMIDLVFFGYSPNETSGLIPTMSLSPTYSET